MGDVAGAPEVRPVIGRASLTGDDGPLFAAVGVFDGLHLGHTYLLDHLVREAGVRGARPAVITFDAHPDAVLLGHAPPLLMDPAERLARLADAGVEVVVIEHFDEALRRTPYDAFVRGISARCALAGILMTPDAAFGHDRAGTPTTLAALGQRDGFEVVVVPPFALHGREVRSSDVRAAIAAGDLAAAERLLGRPYAVVGAPGPDGRLTLAPPRALPPSGQYEVAVGAPIGTSAGAGELRAEAEVGLGTIRLEPPPAADGDVRVAFGPG